MIFLQLVVSHFSLSLSHIQMIARSLGSQATRAIHGIRIIDVDCGRRLEHSMISTFGARVSQSMNDKPFRRAKFSGMLRIGSISVVFFASGGLRGLTRPGLIDLVE